MSEQPQTLWMSADIARELGISPSLVANWSTYKNPHTPPPYATTPGGTRLWSDGQVKSIIADYHARRDVMNKRTTLAAQRKDAKLRAERMIQILNGAA